MMHKIRNVKLGRDKAHSKALLKNLIQSLIRHERIKTTKHRSKVLKSKIEKIITRAKKDNLHNRREVHKYLRDTSLLKKLFEEIAVRFKTRNGGYTRSFSLGKRKGDGSEIFLVEFVEELLSEETGENATAESAKEEDTSSELEAETTVDVKDEVDNSTDTLSEEKESVTEDKPVDDPKKDADV